VLKSVGFGTTPSTCSVAAAYYGEFVQREGHCGINVEKSEGEVLGYGDGLTPTTLAVIESR
jgi:hypothetical protein